MENPISDATQRTLQEWHRGHPESRIAGVCTTIARQFELPLPIVRSGFVIAALIPGLQGIGVTLYLAIWALTPPAPEEPSLLDRVVSRASELFADGRGHRDDEFDDIEGDIHLR